MKSLLYIPKDQASQQKSPLVDSLFGLTVFHRLSQHCEPIHWSQVALITNDKFSEHKTLHPDQMPLNSFITRLNLADPQDMVLIECKFELVFWHFLTSPGQLSLFITTVLLQLMCPEFSRLQ